MKIFRDKSVLIFDQNLGKRGVLGTFKFFFCNYHLRGPVTHLPLISENSGFWHSSRKTWCQKRMTANSKENITSIRTGLLKYTRYSWKPWQEPCFRYFISGKSQCDTAKTHDHVLSISLAAKVHETELRIRTGTMIWYLITG